MEIQWPQRTGGPMNHSGPGNFPISLPINSRPGNDVKNPDNNQEPVLSAYGGGTFAKKTVIHSGTGLSGYLEKLASRARIFHGAFKTSPPSARGSSKTSSFLRREFLPLAEGFLQEVSWTIPCAMSSRAFPSPFAFKKAEKKALFKFVYSRTRAYGTGTTKAPPRVPTRFREKIIRPFPSVRQNKRFPGPQPESAVHPGTFCKKPFPIQIIQCRNGETGTLPHQSAHVPPPCPCQSSHT